MSWRAYPPPKLNAAPVESGRGQAAKVDTDALRLEVSRGAFDAETPHRVEGWVRTLPRDELGELIRVFEAHRGPIDKPAR